MLLNKLKKLFFEVKWCFLSSYKTKKKLINPFLHLYISYYYSILNILGKVGLSEVPEGDIRKNVNNKYKTFL